MVGAVGVIGIGTAATFTGIFTHEISELISEIHDEQVRLENKKRQVAALRGITTTVNSLKEKNEAARTSLTNIQTMWESLAAKLEAVSKNLKKGGEAAELAVKRMNIGAAVNSWNDTAEWARKIQDLASGTSVHARPVQARLAGSRLPLSGRGARRPGPLPLEAGCHAPCANELTTSMARRTSSALLARPREARSAPTARPSPRQARRPSWLKSASSASKHGAALPRSIPKAASEAPGLQKQPPRRATPAALARSSTRSKGIGRPVGVEDVEGHGAHAAITGVGGARRGPSGGRRWRGAGDAGRAEGER